MAKRLVIKVSTTANWRKECLVQFTCMHVFKNVYTTSPYSLLHQWLYNSKHH